MTWAEVRKAKPVILWLIGADSGAVTREDLPEVCFVIYQGLHGDAGAAIADCVKAYREAVALCQHGGKDSIYIPCS